MLTGQGKLHEGNWADWGHELELYPRCTELPLLIRPVDAPVPLFDTTRLHAEAATELALFDN
jgi:hypothetical protein